MKFTLPHGLGRFRSDLIDADPWVKQLWEVKTAREWALGQAKLRMYLLIFNWADPDKMHPWTAGTAATYTLSELFFPLDTYGTYAIVSPPLFGVITYKLINFRATIATVATVAISSMSIQGTVVSGQVGVTTVTATMGGF